MDIVLHSLSSTKIGAKGISEDRSNPVRSNRDGVMRQTRIGRLLEGVVFTLGAISAVVSIPVDWPEFQEKIPFKALNILTGSQYICIAISCFAIYGFKRIFNQWEHVSPEGGRVSLKTFRRIYWPPTLHKLFVSLCEFQICLLRKKNIRSSYRSIHDEGFVNVVVNAILTTVQNLFRQLTGREVCVQLFAFEREQKEGPEIGDIYDCTLVQYCAVNPPTSYNYMDRRQHEERFQITREATASALKKKAENADPAAPKYHFGFQRPFRSARHCWISNKLRRARDEDKFYTNSKYFNDGYYESMAVFFVSSPPGATGEIKESAVFGLLVIDTIYDNAFDDRLTALIGNYVASRIYHFIGNSERDYAKLEKIQNEKNSDR